MADPNGGRFNNITPLVFYSVHSGYSSFLLSSNVSELAEIAHTGDLAEVTLDRLGSKVAS
jgi:hypothetical protein